MDVDFGYKYIEKFRGGVQWYMMQTKDFVSSFSLKLKNENIEIVSFNGQSITFPLSIREIYIFITKKAKDNKESTIFSLKKIKIKIPTQIQKSKNFAPLPSSLQAFKVNLLSGNG